MCASGRTVLVRHSCQQDDLDAVAEHRQSFCCAVGDALPVGLPTEELVEQRRHFRLLDQPAARLLGDVAGQAERGKRQAEAARLEKTRKGPDKFEHDIVDIEHEQRPVVGRELCNLARCFWIVAHVEVVVAVVAEWQGPQRDGHTGRRDAGLL